MKKYILLFSLLLASTLAVHAQDDQPGDDAKKQERIKALYVAYITQQLQLNPDEAQKFWPVHAQLESELKSVRSNIPELDKQQSILNIKKRYQENFNRILGANRCERFFRMDGDFKHKLLEKIRNNRQNKPMRPKTRMRL